MARSVVGKTVSVNLKAILQLWFLAPIVEIVFCLYQQHLLLFLMEKEIVLLSGTISPAIIVHRLALEWACHQILPSTVTHAPSPTPPPVVTSPGTDTWFKTDQSKHIWELLQEKFLSSSETASAEILALLWFSLLYYEDRPFKNEVKPQGKERADGIIQNLDKACPWNFSSIIQTLPF